MRARSVAAALAAALGCQIAFAFGAEGHRAVGTIADAVLAGTRAGKEARKLLGSNLRTASVWADCAKGVGEKNFKYGGRGKYAECQVYENPASEQQMEAFVRRNVGNCVLLSKSESCHREYHYTDVAIQRDAYRKGLAGTSDHDVVSAINACIAVLDGRPSPAPFRIASKKEALRLLTHYVGDIHQPLHVASVYLDKAGAVVDPDAAPDPDSPTTGGNDLLVGSGNLHALWDGVGGEVTAAPPTETTWKAIHSMQPTGGAITEWSTAWAGESLALGTAKAFAGLQYSAEQPKHKYRVTLPPDYTATRKAVQTEQVVKAGVRLAAVLKALWPD